MSKTKIVGYLILAIAILNLAKDLLDGGGFDLNIHLNQIQDGLFGAGLVFLRSGLDKVSVK
jgi:hypothetical protein